MMPLSQVSAAFLELAGEGSGYRHRKLGQSAHRGPQDQPRDGGRQIQLRPRRWLTSQHLGPIPSPGPRISRARSWNGCIWKRLQWLRLAPRHRDDMGIQGGAVAGPRALSQWFSPLRVWKIQFNPEPITTPDSKKIPPTSVLLSETIPRKEFLGLSESCSWICKTPHIYAHTEEKKASPLHLQAWSGPRRCGQSWDLSAW